MLEEEIQSGARIQSLTLNNGRSAKQRGTTVVRVPEVVHLLLICYNVVQNTKKNKDFY